MLFSPWHNKLEHFMARRFSKHINEISFPITLNLTKTHNPIKLDCMNNLSLTTWSMQHVEPCSNQLRISSFLMLHAITWASNSKHQNMMSLLHPQPSPAACRVLFPLSCTVLEQKWCLICPTCRVGRPHGPLTPNTSQLHILSTNAI